jgi:hypothetical protein
MSTNSGKSERRALERHCRSGGVQHVGRAEIGMLV